MVDFGCLGHSSVNSPSLYWVAKVGKAVIKLTLNSKLIMKLKNLRDNLVDPGVYKTRVFHKTNHKMYCKLFAIFDIAAGLTLASW